MYHRFQKPLAEERRKFLKQGFDNLGAIFNLTVLSLRKLLINNNPSIRLKASQTIIDYNLRLLQRE